MIESSSAFQARQKFTHWLAMLGVCGLLLSPNGFAEQPLFNPLGAEQPKPLSLVLSAPISKIYNEKDNEKRPYHDAFISYKDEAGETIRVPVKIKTRGNFRRANCKFPPLRLNFAKKTAINTLFAGQDKLKVVGPCQLGGVFRDAVGVEQLAYQIFELVSDNALRTRAVELSYIDNGGYAKPRTFPVFLIEDREAFADRQNAKRVKIKEVERDTLNLSATALLEVFAYFIGNSDYSTLVGRNSDECCHNVMIFAPKKSSINNETQNNSVSDSRANGHIPVPYDFDMSGLVDAPYAAPPPFLPIRSVTQRLFRGWCKEDRHFVAAVDVFKAKRAALEDLVTSNATLSKSRKKRLRKFIDEFYTKVATPADIQNNIVAKCRGAVVTG